MEDYEIEIIEEMRENGYEGTDDELIEIRLSEYDAAMRELEGD